MKNKVIQGDNIKVLQFLIEKGMSEKIQLIYIDPPYLTNRVFKCKNANIAYKDKWKCVNHYLSFLKKRLILSRKLLTNTGSFYLHCDYRVSHHVKLLLDEIFGIDNFKNEIIWHYTGGGRSKLFFSRKHDSIFFYTKSNNYIFNYNDIRVPYKESSGYASNGIFSKNWKIL